MKNELTARERFLIRLIGKLKSTILNKTDFQSRERQFDRGSLGTDVHFEFWRDERELAPGDIVYANSGSYRSHKWSISKLVERKGHSHWLVEDVFTGVICDYSNEGFVPIAGLDEKDMWNEDQLKMVCKIEKAFSKVEYMVRNRGISFEGNSVSVTTGRRWDFDNKHTKNFTMKWNKRTTIKSIVPLIENAQSSD